MTFKLNIERVYGGYLLTIEDSNGVERRVIGTDVALANNLSVLSFLDKAVGCTILDKIRLTTENKHVVLNIESYGDVEQIDVEPSETQEWSEDEERAINDIMWCISAYRERGFNESHQERADRAEKFIRSLQPRKSEEWTVEDEGMYNNCLVRLGSSNPKQPETVLTKWFKEHCYKPYWKPSEEQMKELYTMLCECRPADTQLLSDIYWGLKSL